MGYNSGILVLNDRISEIERDPKKFVEEMVRSISKMSISDGPVDFYPGQSTVMSCEHADAVTILAVGGNYSSVLGRFFNGGVHHTPEAQDDLLRRLANEHGYRLVRKSEKKRSA